MSNQGWSNRSGQSGNCLTTFQKLAMPQSKIINLCVINEIDIDTEIVMKLIFYIAALGRL